MTADPVSLDDLKLAIEATQRIPDDWNDHADSPGEYAVSLTRDAWRTAFEWRAQFHGTGLGNLSLAQYYEFKEGMALIREKLT